MRERIMRFMMGRYGADEFSRFLLVVSLVFLVINMFVRNGWFYLLAIAVLAYSYYRILSKNHSKRYRENAKYLDYKSRFMRIFNREKSYMNQRKTHHIYTCRNCRQKIRIPRGKGKIEVTCPKCGYRFVKRS